MVPRTTALTVSSSAVLAQFGPPHTQRQVGWLAISFFGLGIAVSLLESVIPSWLLLEADGFTLWRPAWPIKAQHHWIGCGVFETVEMTDHQGLVDYLSHDRQLPSSDAPGQALDGGTTKYLSDGNGGMTATQLAESLNGYRDWVEQ